ncbi:carbohydrate-binding protein, partial [Bacillus solimangrovi]|uniref:carbohydrate-binding protein n=1 Tax=Bacillus solimangrovi TaxID=1305675 RepID=UPI000B2BB053
DMYAGHTWASGHAKFFDGNNNESSSEAMNAWAGIILWGEATDNKELRDLGIYLFTTEMNAINEYWFDVTGENHDPGFTRETASMVWGGKTVGDAVWWTNNPEEIHGINWLPITGASLYLTQYPDYTKRNYDALVSENGGENWDAWEDIIWMYRAIENPEDAIRQFNARENAFVPEGGNSKANTYHWIHNLNALGNADPTITADYPIHAVFTKDNVKTYVVYNMTNSVKTVTFSDGVKVTVQPHEYSVSNGSSDPIEQPTEEPNENPNGQSGFDAFEKIEAEQYTSMSGVQTEQTSDVGGGLNVGYLDNEDYLVFNDVDFGSGATEVAARIASQTAGGTIELRLDGKDGQLIGTVDLTNTGGWQEWETKTATISNTTGIHDLYVVFKGETQEGIGNLNWLKFVQNEISEPIEEPIEEPNEQPNEQPTINAFDKIEAEQYTAMSGIETEATTDVGGGLNVGWIDNEDYLVFNDVDFGSGATEVAARVASQTAGGAMELRLDSKNGQLIGTVDITNTGGWQNWATNTAAISNATGIHDLYVVFKGETQQGIGNLNWLSFSKESTNEQPEQPNTEQPTDPTIDEPTNDNQNSMIEADDYTVEIVKDDSTNVTFIFNPAQVPASFVDLHYKVNDGGQQNVRATKNGEKWEYTVKGVKEGDSIDFFYTYAKGQLAYDSQWYEYTK